MIKINGRLALVFALSFFKSCTFFGGNEAHERGVFDVNVTSIVNCMVTLTDILRMMLVIFTWNIKSKSNCSKEIVSSSKEGLFIFISIMNIKTLFIKAKPNVYRFCFYIAFWFEQSTFMPNISHIVFLRSSETFLLNNTYVNIQNSLL